MSFQQLAPGLYSKLKKCTTNTDFELLERAFNLSVELGSLDETPIIRENGLSFNPRPARHASIIMKETGILDPLVIGASFFLQVNSYKLNLNNSNLSKTVALAEETSQTLDNHLNINDNLAMPLVVLAYTHTLDRARHLHMTNLQDQEKRIFCDFISHILKKLPKYKESDRLNAMLEAWLKSSQG